VKGHIVTAHAFEVLAITFVPKASVVEATVNRYFVFRDQCRLDNHTRVFPWFALVTMMAAATVTMAVIMPAPNGYVRSQGGERYPPN
jgi:hypothetical protein